MAQGRAKKDRRHMALEKGLGIKSLRRPQYQLSTVGQLFNLFWREISFDASASERRRRRQGFVRIANIGNKAVGAQVEHAAKP